MPRAIKTPEERFWAKVDKSGECWTWTAAKDKDGYGFFYYKGKMQRAHRVAFEMENGPLLDGLQALHECDNPSCVRPAHLFSGTHLDNVADRTAKRRQPVGEDHPDAKLTQDQVDEMRRNGKTGTYKDIGKEYGLSIAQTAKILNYQNWRDC